jgi:hypothetical protein
MGPFLAERISGGLAYWLCGVAIAASAVSLATCPDRTSPSDDLGLRGHQLRDYSHGCKQRNDHRRVLSVGPMLEAGSYRDIMRDTVRNELSTRSPWRIELTDAPSGGFYVDGTVDEMSVYKRDGNAARIYCELKLWVRSADRPITLLSGSANVDTTHGARDIALSRQACVNTVAEELVQRLLVGDPWD